ncbi:MAG: hypothetical protein H8K07_21775 [Nitrospira sp.]|nr:hypothetical protein [Nitrospira sp.]
MSYLALQRSAFGYSEDSPKNLPRVRRKYDGAIYNQYRWRFRRQIQPKNKWWKGLVDADTWQKGYLKPGSAALREIDFWVGA